MIRAGGAKIGVRYSVIPAVLPPFLSDLIILAGFIAATAVKHGDEALSKHHH